jgi:ATP-dependent DNA helicase DinG
VIALRQDFDAEFSRQIIDFFGPSGPLSKQKRFEFRPQQQQMAGAIATTLAEAQHLVVEAGTGVGKSLAYLVPAALYALDNNRKAIVSTHTINLQEQLLQKDIPAVQKLVRRPFQAALLKGRQNYLCPNRLDRALQLQADLFDGPQQQELLRLKEWSQRTTEGTLSDLEVEPDSTVWLQVCSEPHICTPKTCGANDRCFYQRARRKLLTADLIVLNHTLLFLAMQATGDQENRAPGYLFPHDFLVIDEAHTIESVAARQIGLGVSQYGLRQALSRLYSPVTKKGLFSFLRLPDAVRETAETSQILDQFFSSLDGAADFTKGREYRVRRPEIVPDTASLALARLQAAVVSTVKGIEDERLRAELQDLGRRIRDARIGISEFLRQAAEKHVFWVEQAGKTRKNLSLYAVPVDISPILKQLLFPPGRTCIMTSATLSVGSDELDYFRQRVGANDVAAKQIGSPFDYEKQMCLYLVRKMPDPRGAGYELALEQWIWHFLEETCGRAFVLFTSYRTLSSLAQKMAPKIERRFTFLVQGQGLARSRMLSQFQASKNGVLFGTDSFWTGVDVPGEALSNVIITRLPFAVPDHPLIEAKLEFIQESGADPFMEYSLPEAILKLRQGVGRLIRSSRDRGIVVILDNRIMNKQYGRAFLDALPKCPIKII